MKYAFLKQNMVNFQTNFALKNVQTKSRPKNLSGKMSQTFFLQKGFIIELGSSLFKMIRIAFSSYSSPMQLGGKRQLETFLILIDPRSLRNYSYFSYK